MGGQPGDDLVDAGLAVADGFDPRGGLRGQRVAEPVGHLAQRVHVAGGRLHRQHGEAVQLDRLVQVSARTVLEEIMEVDAVAGAKIGDEIHALVLATNKNVLFEIDKGIFAGSTRQFVGAPSTFTKGKLRKNWKVLLVEEMPAALSLNTSVRPRQ